MAKDSQTRFVSSKAWDRIEKWSRRKPVFALMGEFSAGKSTLMNFLLRSEALPTQVTATQLPPVWFSWGRRSAYVQRPDGTRENINLDQLEQVGVNDAQFIRIFLESDILEAVDLIDTPGISDPKISTDVWRRAVGQANGVIWCTHATQAWRETERATWVSLPERLQHNSLLLVTRADVLDVKDRQKVLRRVNREAGHLFNRSILFSARDAIMARDKSGDAELWTRSGGGKMVDSFLEITELIMDSRAHQLARYQIDTSLSDAPQVHPLRPRRNFSNVQGTAPLKLVNPLHEGTEPEVVTQFPVRPARVELRPDEVERAPRIDPQEAERLRADMTSGAEIVKEEKEDELRAFFRETTPEDSDVADLSVAPTEDDETDPQAVSVIDETDIVEVQPLSAEAEVAEEENLFSDEDEADTFMASLEDQLTDVPEPEETAQAEPEETPVELSVSSITALMAEQSDDAEDEFEPEPETNGLMNTQVVAMPESRPEIAGSFEDIVNVSVDTPLSAAAMWREVTDGEDMPTNPEALKKVFQAFLEEFDQITADHNARKSDNAVRPMANTSEDTGVERHVL
ncbi:Dynamin family protein [Ruegeria faecimaris]|uniref:Dynamin family protein n=2 Tax=Ruegeria faecimaris TaxID=686389 RepID=A0A521CPW9_9RHOB|nr:dynamin family protein [Ruegeria faecimaris]SMO61519.1 Dynamin family protein [Ruegeria faecimaris]